jgi:hypothetical protein
LVPSCLSMVYINELWSDSFYHVIDFKYFIHMVYIHTFTHSKLLQLLRSLFRDILGTIIYPIKNNAPISKIRKKTRAGTPIH